MFDWWWRYGGGGSGSSSSSISCCCSNVEFGIHVVQTHQIVFVETGLGATVVVVGNEITIILVVRQEQIVKKGIVLLVKKVPLGLVKDPADLFWNGIVACVVVRTVILCIFQSKP